MKRNQQYLGGRWERMEGTEFKEERGKSFEGHGLGRIHYLDCGDDLTAVHMCQNVANYTFQIYEVHYMSNVT